MHNPIDGPGRYIMRNGESVRLVQHGESERFVEGFFLYAVNTAEPETGHLVLPNTQVEHANDIISKA